MDGGTLALLHRGEPCVCVQPTCNRNGNAANYRVEWFTVRVVLGPGNTKYTKLESRDREQLWDTL